MVSGSGSGITIFVIQSNNPLNATMNLDGSVSSVVNGTDPAHNVLYTVQNLTLASHTLNVTLVDYINDGNATGSIIRFNYAAVDPFISSASFSSTSAPTPTPGPPAQSSGSVGSGSAGTPNPK